MTESCVQFVSVPLSGLHCKIKIIKIIKINLVVIKIKILKGLRTPGNIWSHMHDIVCSHLVTTGNSFPLLR